MNYKSRDDVKQPPFVFISKLIVPISGIRNNTNIYMNSHSEALAWGVRYLDVEVIK